MKPTRILVVEDERPMRRNLVTILKMESFDVFEAEDGRKGLAAAREHGPDLIFCDITMPGLDGHGVLRELRADPKTAGIPLVFLTARGDKRDFRTGMNLGADDYLVKPVQVDELLQVIRTRLRRQQQAAPPAKPKREPSPALLVELGLTEREADVLFWVAQGKSNPEVCTLLDLRLTTVKKHVERILQKLSVENRTSAAAAAIEKLNAG
jgi:DNA-binding NarL/FixJ family response regulator